MTLSKFVKDEISRIKRFETNWNKHHQISPNNYPIEMDPGPWDEQLQFFKE